MASGCYSISTLYNIFITAESYVGQRCYRRFIIYIPLVTFILVNQKPKVLFKTLFKNYNKTLKKLCELNISTLLVTDLIKEWTHKIFFIKNRLFIVYTGSQSNWYFFLKSLIAFHFYFRWSCTCSSNHFYTCVLYQRRGLLCSNISCSNNISCFAPS